MKFTENEQTELKKSTSELKEAIISIVAILNKHQYGSLYFGIKNDGMVVGQDISEKTLRDVSKTISENIEPRIYPSVNKIKLDGKDCILVEFQGNEIPYHAFGRAYMRVGDEDRQLSVKELENIIIQKNSVELQWDKRISKKDISEINEKALKRFIEKANEVGRLDFKYLNKETTLKKLGLAAEDKILNAAEVLFCDENPLELQLAIFATNEKLTFLDIKLEKGNIFDLLNIAELYIKNNTRWRVKFGKLEREEIPEIPLGAIREALVNSFCHRDYTVPKGNEVAIFKNRVEIFNPGDFPAGYKPEDFIESEEHSILRNPIIAHNLYLSKDIEKWGSGIKRIYDECQENGVKVEFKVLKSGFVVKFFRIDVKEIESHPTKEIFSGQEKTEKWSRKWSDKQKLIIQLISENKNISRKELSEKVGINPSAIQKHIDKFKKEGILKRVGPNKGGYWELEE